MPLKMASRLSQSLVWGLCTVIIVAPSVDSAPSPKSGLEAVGGRIALGPDAAEYFSDGDRNDTATTQLPGVIRSLSECGPCVCDWAQSAARCDQRGLTAVPSDLPTDIKHLDLAHNGLMMLSDHAFAAYPNLVSLNISHNVLSAISSEAFSETPSLKSVDLSHNSELDTVTAVASLRALEHLDISYCNVSLVSREALGNLSALRNLSLSGNPWNCDCDLAAWFPEWIWQNSVRLPLHSECVSPDNSSGIALMDALVWELAQCVGTVPHAPRQWLRLGSRGILDCRSYDNNKHDQYEEIIWRTPNGEILWPDPEVAPQVVYFSLDTERPPSHQYDSSQTENADRLFVLPNGSLVIDYMTRSDAGNYTCHFAATVGGDGLQGNLTIATEVRVDSSILEWVKIYSIVIGIATAMTFFIITVTVTAIRYFAIKCSSKERLKRNSIREVLSSLHDFKTVQIDKFCAYKTAKINKLSAYKSDKMHKLVAFKTAKVGKLRTYKQVTMASIFHHVEKMKEHYHSQMDRVKDNCSVQVEKLRENYSSQVGKFKGYGAEKIERVRDNYNQQMLRIRDYRTVQMNRLRDQYKLQQQHLLKLMELLDIGNCLNVVEAECMRTESMLFDPNISFDLEAQPVHVHRGDLDLTDSDEDDNSEYLTAGSHTELDADPSPAIVAAHRALSPTTSSAAPDTAGQEETPSLSQKSSSSKPRKRQKKRRQAQSALAVATAQKRVDANVYKTHRHTDSNSSASYTDCCPDLSSLALEVVPPPPKFSCQLLSQLDGKPLEEILASALRTDERHTDIDADTDSLYQTPFSSAHQHVERAQSPRESSCRHSDDSSSTETNPSTIATSRFLETTRQIDDQPQGTSQTQTDVKQPTSGHKSDAAVTPQTDDTPTTDSRTMQPGANTGTQRSTEDTRQSRKTDANPKRHPEGQTGSDRHHVIGTSAHAAGKTRIC